MIFTRLPVLSLLVTTLLLSGCPTPGPKPGGEYPVPDARIHRAEQLLGEAENYASPQRDIMQLQAAELFLREQQLERAKTVLAKINSDRLPLQALADYVLLSAEQASATDNFFTARDLLNNRELIQQQHQLPIETQRRWRRQRGDLFDLLGQELSAIEEYIILSSLLDNEQAIKETHDRLWQALGRVPRNNIQELLKKEQDPVHRGWYVLANLSRANQGDIGRLQRQLDSWRTNWPNHPATRYPPEGLTAIRRIAANLPRHLALLLPLGGDHGAAGATVRDGFMAAYYQVLSHKGTPPKIRIYDTSEYDNIATVYQRAVDNGSALVIGPLKKENVEALNRLGTLPVPVVTLNYLTDGSVAQTNNLFQFGLSVADEARQAAQRAWLEGHRRALAITPQTDLGERTLEAFRNEWERKGGTLVSAAHYQKSEVDFSSVVKPMLLVHQSEQRARQLSQLLGKSLNATPWRRRQDVDMIFMQASPIQARQIKPMLDFFYAANLSVYATSQVYSGAVDPGKDRDLEKVRFPAMPWTLPGGGLEAIKPDTNLHPTYQQLFALGMDAYQIHQGVLQMRVLPQTRLFGSTGTLSLSGTRIVREQPWAEFRHGKVRLARQESGR